MQIDISQILLNFSYFFPYIAFNYIFCFVIILSMKLILKNFYLTSKFNFLYGFFIEESIHKVFNISILISKTIFVFCYFVFSLSYSQIILILFLFFDIIFCFKNFKFFTLFLNIFTSFSIYFLMFLHSVLKKYLETVDSSYYVIITYVGISVFVVLYTMCMNLFLTGKVLVNESPNKEM